MNTKFFPANEHTIDRIVRVILGIALLSMFLFGAAGWWALIGVIPLVTGLAGTCPIYTLLGIGTCPVRR